MSEKEFEPRLGKIGHKKSARPKTFARQVLDVAYKSGFKTKRTSSFTGQRIGRGAAWGTLASAGLMRGGSRRAVIKVRIAKLKAGNLAAPRAHMRYIQRDGVDRSGEPGKLYGPDVDEVDGVEFTERCDGDRHQFRIIVSPDDGDQLSDLKPFVRDLMQQMERDLETKLDWVAVDHHNTGHPHAHVVIRGKDEQGHDLIMARDYVTHGIRQRASELLTLELGPEDEFEQQMKLAREVAADRFTRLDRSILKHVDQGYLTISSLPPQEPEAHTAHMRRLRNLSDLGLAVERQTGVWQIDPAMEQKLRSLGKHNDIIATMHRAMKQAGLDRPAGSFAIFRAEDGSKPVLGKVAALGLTDEINDRHYVVVDGVDGRVHYADIGRVRPEALPEKGMIVSIEAARSQDEAKLRTRLRIQSYLSFEKLAEAEGVTWLDKELLAKTPTPIGGSRFWRGDQDGPQSAAAMADLTRAGTDRWARTVPAQAEAVRNPPSPRIRTRDTSTLERAWSATLLHPLKASRSAAHSQNPSPLRQANTLSSRSRRSSRSCRGDRTWSRCAARKSPGPHQHKAFSGSGDRAEALASNAFPRFLAFPN